MATPDLKWYTPEAQEIFVQLCSEPGAFKELPAKVDWLSDAAKRDLAETRGQTRTESAIETFLNIGSGFLISWGVWLFIAAPLFGIPIRLDSSFALTALFTITSTARSYAWRRIFNHGRITTWLRSLRA